MSMQVFLVSAQTALLTSPETVSAVHLSRGSKAPLFDGKEWRARLASTFTLTVDAFRGTDQIAFVFAILVVDVL